MKTEQSNLWWRSGSVDESLSESLDSLIECVGADEITWSYLERRPGSNLDNDRTMPNLIEGSPDNYQAILLDEVRIFTCIGGIHAVEDCGRTRWMQWLTKSPEDAEENSLWNSEQVIVEEWDHIFMLNNEAARRFGLNKNVLPKRETMKIFEYRRSGELFCWNLTEAVSK